MSIKPKGRRRVCGRTKTSMLKKYFKLRLLIFTIGISSGLVCGQSGYLAKTKLRIVTHATGQCTNPADSKAGLSLSAENGIDIDCNLRLSKDKELVLAHDSVSKRNFWNDLNNTKIPYNKLITEKIGDYDNNQFADEKYVRFEDFLQYLSAEAPDRKLYVEVKAHTAGQQAMAVKKINKFGLADRVYLQADNIEDKNLIRNSKGGEKIKIIMWVSNKESLIDAAITDGQFSAIVMDSSMPDLGRVVDKVAKAGIEVVVYSWYWSDININMLQNKGYDISVMCNTPDHLIGMSPFKTILKPVVAYPANNQKFRTGSTIDIKTYVADNYDNYGKKKYTVTKVEFFANGVLIGTDSNSPYRFYGWKPKDGYYKIKAKIFDDGQVKISNPVTIKVGNE